VSADWECYQKCPVCGAPLGKPCLDFSSYTRGYVPGPGQVDRDRPHSTRKLRAAAARDAQFGPVIGGGR